MHYNKQNNKQKFHNIFSKHLIIVIVDFEKTAVVIINIRIVFYKEIK